MEYVLLIKDQLQVFLGSLQELLAGKHDIVKSSFPPRVNFQLVENLEVEVVRENWRLARVLRWESTGFS